jgi:hypothetical protein
MACSTDSPIAGSTKSTVYFTVRNCMSSFFKYTNLSRVSLLKYLLYKLNRMAGKQHHCLTPLPIFTLLVPPRSSSILILWSMCSLLINFYLCHSIPIYFRILTNLVQFTQSNAFCQHTVFHLFPHFFLISLSAS